MAADFDVAGFSAALRRAATARGADMKTVSAATGVSETTLSRMHNHGRAPDAASLAALSAWAGINPARYSGLRARKIGRVMRQQVDRVQADRDSLRAECERLRVAVEFAEYMAIAAHAYIDATDNEAMKRAARDGSKGDHRPLACDQLAQAEEDSIEAMRTLQSRVYEFRKRAALRSEQRHG